MDITSNQFTTAATAASTPAAGSTGGTATKISSDFETFLKMLTAQARYQDPLEPLDSSEYAAQLAQFSSVEQQVKTNDLLTALSGQFGSTGLAQYAGWIGMEARTGAPVYFDGAPITIAPETPAVADRNVLIVENARGAEVQRLDMPTGNEPLLWAGVDSNGAPLPPGTYGFRVESYANGELLGTEVAETYAQVTETQLVGGQTKVILNGETAVAVEQVTALRMPQPI